jgi:hypothetical protein
VIFPVHSAGGRLHLIHAAARYKLRVPPPDDCDYHLAVSTDGGTSWKAFAGADIPADNEFSSGWVFGTVDIAAAKRKDALVRVNFYQGGYQTGLIDVQIYGVHESPAAGATTATYGWREEDEAKTHVAKIPRGAPKHVFTVPTGEKIVDDFVRIEVK